MRPWTGEQSGRKYRDVPVIDSSVVHCVHLNLFALSFIAAMLCNLKHFEHLAVLQYTY